MANDPVRVDREKSQPLFCRPVPTFAGIENPVDRLFAAMMGTSTSALIFADAWFLPNAMTWMQDDCTQPPDPPSIAVSPIANAPN
jgi:hypothetical protein